VGLARCAAQCRALLVQDVVQRCAWRWRRWGAKMGYEGRCLSRLLIQMGMGASVAVSAFVRSFDLVVLVNR